MYHNLTCDVTRRTLQRKNSGYSRYGARCTTSKICQIHCSLPLIRAKCTTESRSTSAKRGIFKRHQAYIIPFLDPHCEMPSTLVAQLGWHPLRPCIDLMIPLPFLELT